MKIIKIIIQKQKMIVDAPFKVVSGSIGVYGVQVEYDEEWGEIPYKLLMLKGTKTIKLEEKGEIVKVPGEVISEPCCLEFGLIGFGGNGDVRITTYSHYGDNMVVVRNSDWNGDIGSDVVEPPTPTIWEDIKREIDEIKNKVKKIEDEVGNLVPDQPGYGEGITVDDELNIWSENPVQNKVVTQKIGKLSNEIGDLKHPPEKTGNVVSVNAEQDDIITLKGSGEVTLIHQGKNFMPSAKNVYSANGLTFTPQEDGGLKIVGTASGNTSYYIVDGTNPITVPPGTYTFHIRYTGSGNARFFLEYKEGSSWVSLYNSFTMKFAQKTFTFETWTTIRLASFVLSGSVLDEVFYPQLEIGEVTTDFEKYNHKEIETELSCAIRTHEGDNIFYTTELDTITASVWNMREIASVLLDASANQKSGIYVTPSMFGAVCDGVTDDTVALQASIDSGHTVVIDKDIAIYDTITMSNKITIMHGVTVNIRADVDGFILGTGAEINGSGVIAVPINNYTHKCIYINGGKHIVINGIRISGKNHKSPTGIGIHIHSANENTCYNRIENVTVQYFMYGVFIESTETYWNTSNNINVQSEFCGNAIRLKGTGHNWIIVSGESGYNTVNNTEMYLEKSYCNYITTTIVDTNEPNHNQHQIIMDMYSNNNCVYGDILLPNYVQDYGSVNHIYYSGEGVGLNKPIPGIYDIFSDSGYLKTFEVFGNGTELVSSNVFDYPHRDVTQILTYKNKNFESLNPTEWGCKVTLESTYSGGMFIHSLLFSSVYDSKPYKIGCKIFKNETWSQEKEIGHAGINEKEIHMENYFSFDEMSQCSKIQIIFYGSCANGGITQYKESANITAISATTRLSDYADTGDPFAGLRKSGDTAHGDITFVKGKSAVLESPNGTKYKIAVSDDGTLSAVPITT